MIVTIDGPAGSGKSTVAQRLARRLGIAYLDTGAMYRAIALKALRQQVDLNDSEALAALARETQIRFEPASGGQRVIVDGVNVSDSIRTMDVNAATPYVAKVPQVRQALVLKQQHLGEKLGSLVAEGRDQGSVVFPQADVKFVLDGQVGKRAQRRYLELKEAGQDVRYEDVLSNLVERDRQDQKHWLGLLESNQAIRVDTSDMAIDEVVECLYQRVTRKAAADRASDPGSRRRAARVGATSKPVRGYVPLRPWWWLCRTAVFGVCWLLFKSHVIGLRRVPRSGPVILACNHQSFFDPVLATVGLDRESAYMARDTLFANRYFGWLIRSLNAIPIRRGQADVTSLKEMLRRLRDNYVVVIFPEQTRTLDGKVGPMKPGMVLVARKARATIVPVCIEGAYEAWPRSRPLPGPGRVVVAYGQPITAADMRGRGDEDVTAEIRGRIIRMQGAIRQRTGRRALPYEEV
jgi:cytidylate kinase